MDWRKSSDCNDQKTDTRNRYATHWLDTHRTTCLLGRLIVCDERVKGLILPLLLWTSLTANMWRPTHHQPSATECCNRCRLSLSYSE